jgi:hypothetical protein
MHFAMPDLYRVVHGINVFDPKFNIVSPAPTTGCTSPTRTRNTASAVCTARSTT